MIPPPVKINVMRDYKIDTEKYKSKKHERNVKEV